MDIDPDVVRFNRINTALLQASASREHYLKLRRSVVPEGWQRTLDSKDLDPDSRKILSDPVNWEWWSDAVIRNPGFQKLNDGPKLIGPSFRNANYLHYDDQFSRIQKLAKAGRIHSFEADLTSPEKMKAIVTFLKDKNSKLSVLDISNCPDYFDSAGFKENLPVDQITARVIRKFQDVAQPDSIYMQTVMPGSAGMSSLDAIWAALKVRWTYHGFLFGELKSDAQLKSMLEKMRLGNVSAEYNKITHIEDTPVSGTGSEKSCSSLLEKEGEEPVPNFLAYFGVIARKLTQVKH